MILPLRKSYVVISVLQGLLFWRRQPFWLGMTSKCSIHSFYFISKHRSLTLERFSTTPSQDINSCILRWMLCFWGVLVRGPCATTSHPVCIESWYREAKQCLFQWFGFILRLLIFGYCFKGWLTTKDYKVAAIFGCRRHCFLTRRLRCRNFVIRRLKTIWCGLYLY